MVLTVTAFVFVLGVLIFVHELGHFLMARAVGVRVITFSLGFGPKLLAFRRGDTEYCVSAIPLGGYVKMAGETHDDPCSGRPDEFQSKSKWQRFQILVMGPTMNIVLAVVLMWVVFSQAASPVVAAKMSFQHNYEWIFQILQTLVGLFSGATSPKQLMGPIAIAQASGASAALGWTALLSLMAMISLNLGIMNLLPIPVLDGGHIFIMALEGLARRTFSVKVKEGMLLTGFAVLMLLMVTATCNDLARIPLTRRLMFWM